MRADSVKKRGISRALLSMDFGFVDEMTSISTNNSFAYALKESYTFFSWGNVPVLFSLPIHDDCATLHGSTCNGLDNKVYTEFLKNS